MSDCHENDKEYHRAYYLAHREEIIRKNTIRARENSDRVRAYHQEYRRLNSKKMKLYFQRYARKHRREKAEYLQRYWTEHKQELMAKQRAYAAKTRAHCMEIIAQRWGDAVPRCRFDTLPENHPLRHAPCYGKLQADHMNGDGAKDRRNFYCAVASGKRGVEDLRVLCRLHQLWNQQY